MAAIEDGVIVVEDTDDDGNAITRPASVAEQNALILQSLEGATVL